MKQLLLDVINEQYYPSILDIVDIIPEFTGNYEWYINSNTSLWNKCSEEGIRSINGLLKDKIILAFQDSIHIHFFWPGVAPYDFAKSLTRNYINPRWLPISFTTQNRIDRDGTTGIEPIDLSMSEIRPTPICIKKNGPKPVFPYFK
jgi:hypothetical protein